MSRHPLKPTTKELKNIFTFFQVNQVFALLKDLKGAPVEINGKSSVQNFLAFAAVGVRPEPNAWPGKATLRPVSTTHCQDTTISITL